MRTGRPGFVQAILSVALAASLAASAGACGSRLIKHYEYEEDVHLSLDGSAVVYVNSSIPALVALRGLALDANPASRVDRTRVRELFSSPVTRVTRVSTSRRAGRRFVHVRIEVDRIAGLAGAAPFAWATYRFEQSDGNYAFQQVVGPAAGRDPGAVNWAGDEIVAFRLHVPSRIEFHNTKPENLQRGNILVWEQSLSARRAGTPLDMQVRMQTSSILVRTLLLFAISGVGALGLLVLLIWLVVRRGRAQLR